MGGGLADHRKHKGHPSRISGNIQLPLLSNPDLELTSMFHQGQRYDTPKAAMLEERTRGPGASTITR